jgi:hypothetical protein
LGTILLETRIITLDCCVGWSGRDVGGSNCDTVFYSDPTGCPWRAAAGKSGEPPSAMTPPLSSKIFRPNRTKMFRIYPLTTSRKASRLSLYRRWG